MSSVGKSLILKVMSIIVGVATLVVGTGYALSSQNVDLTHPAGPIAEQQYQLLLVATGLMLVVVIPVFVMILFISLRYREDNTSAHYAPNWEGSRIAEVTWWGLPLLIIAILAVITWQSSHTLDPYKSLASETKPLHIQVVALEWQWLFIYPEQRIATLNHVRFPEKTPLHLTLTADAPMNSFWIPKLGGQIYAMPGMNTQLHLQANTQGVFRGSSANISGEHFADMRFTAESVSTSKFDAWLQEVYTASPSLDWTTYQKLAKPSRADSTKTYILKDPGLYDTIVEKYMSHSRATHQCIGTQAHICKTGGE